MSDYSNYTPTTIDSGPLLFKVTLGYVIFVLVALVPTVWLGRRWKKYRKQKRIAKKLARKQRERQARRKKNQPLHHILIMDGKTETESIKKLESQLRSMKKVDDTRSSEPLILPDVGAASVSPVPVALVDHPAVTADEENQVGTWYLGDNLPSNFDNVPDDNYTEFSDVDEYSSKSTHTTNDTNLIRSNVDEENLLEDILNGIIDPDLGEEDKDRTEVVYIPHEEHTAQLFETNALDTNVFSRQKGKVERKNLNFIKKETFDDEEEDERPWDAFEAYYQEHGEDDSVNSRSNNESAEETMTRGCGTVCKVINPCDKETRKILKIAAPSTLSIISTLLDATTSALIASHVGTSSFAAYVLVGSFLGITDSFTSGVKEAESILVSQAIGMENYVMAGQYTQLSIVLYVVIAIPTYAMWVYFADSLVLLIGLSEEVAQITKEYIPYAVLSYFFGGVGDGLSTLLWCNEHGMSVTIIETVFHCWYVAAVAIACYCFGVVSINVIAYIGIAYGATYTAFIWVVATYRGWLKPFQKGLFRKFAMRNWNLVKGVLKMSLPMSLGSLLAHGEWEILTFFVATMGEAEVAAWFIAVAIWEVFEYAPSGISTATEIRVGYHLGNGNPGMAKISAYKCLMLTIIFSSLLTGIFYYLSDNIIACFTDDPTLTSMLQEIVPLIGVGNVLLCIGSDMYYVITSQARAKLATLVSFFCTWAITLPLSAFFVFVMNFDLQGVVCAVIIGYGTVAFAFLYLVFTSNWAKRSKKIIKKAEEATESSKKAEFKTPTAGIQA